MKKFSTWLRERAECSKDAYFFYLFLGHQRKYLDKMVKDYIIQESSQNTGGAK